ncbi:MAG: helix-turn-helix domain-containing protein [Blastocatellia bacterium]
MIKWTVREVAERAGINSAYELMQEAEIHVTTAYQLWKGTARRLDISTLNKLCKLFRVPPGQLLEFVADENGQGPPRRTGR